MVAGLTTFIQQGFGKGCIYSFDIKSQVEKYKRKYPNQKPKIIFDFMACLCMTVTTNNQEVLSGGRQLKCTYLAKQFCEKFKDLDVDLIFFLDGPIKKNKIPHYIESSNTKYANQQELFDSIRKDKKIKFFIRSPKLSVYMKNFLTSIKEYGKICISFENECDADIANYATTENALAVVTLDTDFLIFPGDWQVWLVNTLNKKEFKMKAWNKYNVRKALNLRQEHMPIFATLSGNDFVKYEYVKHFHSTDREVPKQTILAQYILKEFPRGVPLNKDKFDKLALIVYNGGNNNIKLLKAKELVSCSLNFYNYQKRNTAKIDIWHIKYIQKVNTIVPYMILNNLIITVNQNMIDMSLPDFKPYSELVLPIIRRQMGILLDHKRELYPEREICFKPSHEEPFQIKKFTPLYYHEKEKSIPKLEDLYKLSTDDSTNFSENANDVSLETKIKFLIWILSSKENNNLTVDLFLNNLTNPILISMITVNYLVKETQITTDEADILLISIKEAMDMDENKYLSLGPPSSLKVRDFWIGKVFDRLFEVIRSSFDVCGIILSSNISYFDGYIFHKMSQSYSSIDEEMKAKVLKPIENYRIYL